MLARTIRAWAAIHHAGNGPDANKYSYGYIHIAKDDCKSMAYKMEQNPVLLKYDYLNGCTRVFT